MKAAKKPTPRIVTILFWVILILILSWILILSDYSFFNTWRMKQSVSKLNTEVLALKAANDSLRQENERLKTNPEAAEKAAREKFGLTKPGEKVFRFVPPAETGDD